MNVDEIKFLRSCAGNEDSFQKLLQYAKKQYRYRYLSDAIADGVVITQNGVIVDANMATTRIFGYDYDEIPNRHLMDFEAPDSIQKIPYEIRDNLDMPYEITGVHKDGHIFPAEIEGRNVEYDGELYRVIVVRDITDRKRLQAEIEEMKAHNWAILDSTSDAIWTFDMDRRLIMFNTAYYNHIYNTFGIQLARGMKLSEVLPKDRVEFSTPYYERAFASERVTYEYKYESENREYFVEFVLNPIITDGLVTGVAGFGRDITERKRDEKALQEAQANILALVENANGAIWSVDRELRLVTFNSTLARSYFTAYGILLRTGMHLSEMLFGEAYQSIRPNYERALQGERVLFDYEFQQGNETFYREISLSPLTICGQITGVVAFGRDVTDRKRFELELQKSQENLTALIENTSDLIWSFDHEYNLVTFNSNFKNYISKMYEIEVTPGMNRFALGLSEEDTETKNFYDRALGGEKFSFEREYRIQEQIIYGEISLNPVIHNGIVTSVAAFGKDITEWKRNELALKTSQANIAALIENTADSYWSLDREYCLLTLNTVFSDIVFNTFGIRIKVGDCLPEVLPPEYPEFWMPLFNRCLTGERIQFNLENKMGGETKYSEVSINPIISDGIITGVACVSRDITERKKSEERNRQHAALLDIANEAIFVRDLDSTVLFWNKAAEKLYGWLASEVIGRSVTGLLYDKENIHTFKQAWDELLFSGHWSGELTHHSRSGKEITVYCRWTLVFDPDGKPASVLSLHSDITEQKSLQQQFYRSQRLESLGTLASGIAHDLNNVLTPILLTVEILRLKYPEEKNSKILETIELSAKRGADIVKQVLLFSKGSGGERIPLSLAESIREIELIIQKTFSKSIELHVNISDNVQPVLGDSTQIQQILMNLCVNARDAMPGGGTLRIELNSKIPTSEVFKTTPEAKSREYSVLTITDSGTGIPQEVLEWIFDPFFTTKEPGSGTGLGLSTVNAIVKSHNGFIKVYSKEDEGTSFEIWLPAFKEIEFKQVLPGSIEVVLSGLGKTILIVDDEPLLLQIITFTLQKFNFTILTASNGQEALLVYSKHPEIELVITDINMPGMDGPTLIAELILINPALKFIVMTGLPINNKMDQMKTIGVSSFLSKPFQTQVLLNAIENAFKADVENV